MQRRKRSKVKRAVEGEYTSWNVLTLTFPRRRFMYDLYVMERLCLGTDLMCSATSLAVWFIALVLKQNELEKKWRAKTRTGKVTGANYGE